MLKLYGLLSVALLLLTAVDAKSWKKLRLKDFNSVHVTGPLQVELIPEDVESVIVRANDSALIDEVEARVDDEENLFLSYNSSSSQHEHLVVYVNFVNLHSLELHGLSKVTAPWGIESDHPVIISLHDGSDLWISHEPVVASKVTIESSSHGPCNVLVKSDLVEVNGTGTGVVELRGTAKNVTVLLVDDAKFYGGGVTADYVTVNATDRSTTCVRAVRELRVMSRMHAWVDVLPALSNATTCQGPPGQAVPAGGYAWNALAGSDDH